MLAFVLPPKLTLNEVTLSLYGLPQFECKRAYTQHDCSVRTLLVRNFVLPSSHIHRPPGPATRQRLLVLHPARVWPSLQTWCDFAADASDCLCIAARRCRPDRHHVAHESTPPSACVVARSPVFQVCNGRDYLAVVHKQRHRHKQGYLQWPRLQNLLPVSTTPHRFTLELGEGVFATAMAYLA